MTLRLAYVEGVTPAKWLRIWAERFADAALEATRTTQPAQLDALLDGRADLVLARLPLLETNGVELSVIPLYSELAVVVVPKDHAIAAAGELTLAELTALLGESPTGFAPSEPDLAMAMELVAAGTSPVIVPHSIARLHSRKDLVSRTVTDAEETRIAMVWPTAHTSEDIEEFIAIVRGRTAQSSRGITPETNASGKVLSRAAKAKAAARARREAAGNQSKPGQKQAGQKQTGQNNATPHSSPRPKPRPGRGHGGGAGGKRKKGNRG